MNQIKLPEIPHGIHLTNFFPPLQLSVWDELSSGSFKRLAQLQLQFAGAESKHEPELYQFCSFCKHTCCGCQMLSKSTQNPESKRKTLSCCNKICILPPIGSTRISEQGVGGWEPTSPCVFQGFWMGLQGAGTPHGMDAHPAQWVGAHSVVPQPQCCFVPGLWAAPKAPIRDRIPPAGWLRQAIKCHYTRVIDSEDQFRLPLWAVSGTNSF